ncbi:hypothetical protein [Methyloceanibacter caenitepidi]|uniref:Phage protein n=1 Tax=Methyloceanibacter caenitepidi TaxID=1384459 RepID=A0A0A8K5W8_9HYPH|nr:hypothetical protein [Methyloceanibacter caenitepidi]BAQ18338.1 hypothetical protein GL4_2905 [Methyloceanibacter caenitepidi]
MPQGNIVKVDKEAEIVERARALREADPETWTWRRLGAELGVGYEWLKLRIIPGYREQKNARRAVYRGRAASRLNEEIRTPAATHHKTEARPISDEELKRRRSVMVHDNRDLTQRLMGDPPFERSALAQRQKVVELPDPFVSVGDAAQSVVDRLRSKVRAEA